MDTRTIVAVALMLLIYMYFFQPTPPVQQPAAGNYVSESRAQTSAQSASASQPLTAVPSELQAKIFELKNDVVSFKVNGLGSVLSATLPKYKKVQGSKDPVQFQYEIYGLNQGQLRTNLGPVEWKLKSATENEIALVSVNSGLEVTRRITLESGAYYLTVKDELKNSSKQQILANQSIVLEHGYSKDQKAPGFWESLFKPQADIQQAVIFADGSLNKKLLADANTLVEKETAVSWSGFSHKYFFMGAVPQDVSIEKVKQYRSDRGIVQEMILNPKQIGSGETSAYTTLIYVGPKDIPELTKASADLPKVIEYGDWIGPIARFLLNILHFFYGIIANYGVAIILLTILVKVVLFPLALKSAVSMRKLQLVAPKMKEIREKYKDDKYRMNAEVMALYKTEKVNPVGGCLPLLLQMPVFFALYRVFFVSIELRQAPFVFWIGDLAAHDKYLVTPILMTLLMWLQQRLTPMPPIDEDNEAARIQRSMLKWMPIMFGGIMLFLPAGLCLYMFTNALISVFQQIWMNKHLNLKFPLPNASQSQASA